MATSVQIPLEEYLRTSYRPDREYLGGDVVERHVGKWEHARVQALLAAWFGNHEQAWGVMVATEQRVQVSATRVRIPDVVLVKAGPQPDVLVEAPVLMVEILSPEDSYAATQRRAAEYVAMGVGAVWAIDPQGRRGRQFAEGVWTEGMRMTVPGTEIWVDLADLFSRVGGEG